MQAKEFLMPTKEKWVMFAFLFVVGILSGIFLTSLIGFQSMAVGYNSPVLFVCYNPLSAIFSFLNIFVLLWAIFLWAVPGIVIYLTSIALSYISYYSGFWVYGFWWLQILVAIATHLGLNYLLACFFVSLDRKVKPKIKMPSIIAFLLLLLFAALVLQLFFCFM